VYLGRPFGGVGILYRKNLSSKLRVVGYHSESRCVAVTFVHGNLRLLCLGVYLPCDDGSQRYHNSLSDVLGFIESTVELYPDYKCMVLGDFNFECDTSSQGYRDFTFLMNEMNLTVCDAMDSKCVGYTYAHNTLNHISLIDHVFVHKDVVSLISEYRVLLDATNCSDHLPVQLISLAVDGNSDCSNTSLGRRNVCDYRWDKGDLSGYYFDTGRSLSNITRQFSCLDVGKHCESKSCHIDINIYYNEIVHCLKQASQMYTFCS